MLISKDGTESTCKNSHSLERVYLHLGCVLSIENNNNLISKIVALLKNLDGLESAMDSPSDHPCAQMIQILHDSERWPISSRPYWIARQVSQLTAFYYQTAGDRDRWNPLHLSRSSFIALNDRSETWHDEHPFPEPKDVLAWLLS